MKSIFISHVHEDNKCIDKMKSWEEKGLMETYTFTFETEDKRQEGKAEIKNYLKQKIKGCAALVVLVGDNTHNHDWIQIEVELANSFNKKICCMRIPNTTGMAPKILKNYNELGFNPNQITKALK